MCTGTGGERITILSIDHPLMDVHANVPLELYAKYNVEVDGACLAGPDQRGLFIELIEKYKTNFVPGGAAQNTIRMMQWIGYDSKIMQCSYMGCIGADIVGRYMLTKMKKTGVKVRYQVSKQVGTGMCTVLVNGRNRSLVTSLGAASLFTAQFLKLASSWAMVEKATIFYIMGYFIGTCMDSMNLLLEHIVGKRKHLCFNLSSPYIVRNHKEKIEKILPCTDFVVGTVDEASAYAEAMGLNCTGAAEVAKYIANLPRVVGEGRSRVVVLTNGPAPIISVKSGDDHVSYSEVEPVASELIVDTNGAGDAFAAGFLVSYIKHFDLGMAIAEGKKAARYIIKQSGFTLGNRRKYDMISAPSRDGE